jgi:Spy/CpxP family protein refolding chaperone
MKYMKSITTAFLVLFAAAAFGQENGSQKDHESRREKVEKLKIAYITTELDLTTAEAEKFWPVYNEQENKLKELRKSGHEAGKKAHENFDSLSDADAKKALDTWYENEAKENNIRKEYSDKFIAIIGARRTLKLMNAEHEFRRELLHRLKDQQDGREKGPKGPHDKK